MKKKLLALTLVLTLFISVFSISFSAEAANEGLLGDADGDGAVTTNDALLVLRYAAGIEDTLTEEAKVRCDINEDGYITLFDARKILRGAAGLANLEPTGLFKGFYTANGTDIETKEELLEYFNTNINKVKTERYGFIKLPQEEDMQSLEFSEATVLGRPTENAADLIKRIMAVVNENDDDSADETLVVQGNSSKNIMSIEGETYVSALTISDIYGARAEYDAARDIIKITIALPDTEKCDLFDSSYVRAFNTENLLAATGGVVKSIFQNGYVAGSETVHYKNAVLVAEFEKSTGYLVSYTTSYETEVYIDKAQFSAIYTLKDINYKTVNTVEYIDFVCDREEY